MGREVLGRRRRLGAAPAGSPRRPLPGRLPLLVKVTTGRRGADVAGLRRRSCGRPRPSAPSRVGACVVRFRRRCILNRSKLPAVQARVREPARPGTAWRARRPSPPEFSRRTGPRRPTERCHFPSRLGAARARARARAPPQVSERPKFAAGSRTGPGAAGCPDSGLPPDSPRESGRGSAPAAPRPGRTPCS